MPFCQHCGSEFKEDSKFCPSCGQLVTEQPTPPTPPPQQPQQQVQQQVSQTQQPSITQEPVKKKKKNSFLIGCLIVIGVIIFIIILSAVCATCTEGLSSSKNKKMSELVKVKEVTGAKCNSCCEVFNADTIETEKPYRIVRDKEYIFNYRDTVCAKCEEKIAEEAKVLFEEGKQLYNSGNYKEAKAKFEKAKKKGHKQADEWINKATSRSGSISSSSKEWYEDGNLHKATVAQWKNASYQNKLATASDWLAATIWKGHLTSPNDFVRLKVKSQMLVNAIDEAVKAEGIDEQQINEIAAALVMMSDDLGP